MISICETFRWWLSHTGLLKEGNKADMANSLNVQLFSMVKNHIYFPLGVPDMLAQMERDRQPGLFSFLFIFENNIILRFPLLRVWLFRDDSLRPGCWCVVIVAFLRIKESRDEIGQDAIHRWISAHIQADYRIGKNLCESRNISYLLVRVRAAFDSPAIDGEQQLHEHATRVLFRDV